jgi:threonyl-tRNA synthetase
MWSSSSYILAYLLCKNHGMKVTNNIEFDKGFYCEGFLDQKLTKTDIKTLEDGLVNFNKTKQFVKKIVGKTEVEQYFSHLDEDLGENISVCCLDGEFFHCKVDQKLKFTIRHAIITNVSSACYKDRENCLTRVYGVTFKNDSDYNDYIALQAELEKRDHRKIGQDLKLFFFSDKSPGSCFFLPHGQRIYNKLREFICGEYKKRGFEEVSTPNIYSKELWEISGHWEKYKENIFHFGKDDEVFGLKPMNCPGHCVMFQHGSKSYKDLPIRYADFSVLHRNEMKGALTGLTRVRKFCQDDAHIFCRQDQVADEVASCLEFLESVYSKFGFEFEIGLSTRPDVYIGSLEVWQVAEMQLRQILNSSGKTYFVKDGDGAFYGPKIDIQLKDSIGRYHQCATIQLDFNLPSRFGLEYVNRDGNVEQPIMIHRAIYGSFERFIAILLETFAGRLPFWISPRQIMVIPVYEDDNLSNYCNMVAKELEEYYVDVDSSDNKLGKKILEAQMLQYNFIVVLGKKELESGLVNVRSRDDGKQVVMTMNEFKAMLKVL